MESSLCEKPERHAPMRRLSDYLMLEGQKMVHSLVDKVYTQELEAGVGARSSQIAGWWRA